MNFGTSRAQCDELRSSDSQSDIDPIIVQGRKVIFPHIFNNVSKKKSFLKETWVAQKPATKATLYHMHVLIA